MTNEADIDHVVAIAVANAIAAERSALTVQSLADIGFRLSSIDREIGAIQEDMRSLVLRVMLTATTVTAVTSVVVSALTAVAVVRWVIA